MLLTAWVSPPAVQGHCSLKGHWLSYWLGYNIVFSGSNFVLLKVDVHEMCLHSDKHVFLGTCALWHSWCMQAMHTRNTGLLRQP